MTDPLTYPLGNNVLKSHSLLCSLHQSMKELKADYSFCLQKSQHDQQYLPILMALHEDLWNCSRMIASIVEVN